MSIRASCCPPTWTASSRRPNAPRSRRISPTAHPAGPPGRLPGDGGDRDTGGTASGPDRFAVAHPPQGRTRGSRQGTATPVPPRVLPHGLAAAALIVLAIGLWATRWDSAPRRHRPSIDRRPGHLGGSERAGSGRSRGPSAAPRAGRAGRIVEGARYIGNGSHPKKDAAPSATGRNSRMQETALPPEHRRRDRRGRPRKGAVEQRQAKPEREPAAPAAGSPPPRPVSRRGVGAPGPLEDTRWSQGPSGGSPGLPAVRGDRTWAVCCWSHRVPRLRTSDGTVVLSAEGTRARCGRTDHPSIPNRRALRAGSTTGETAASPSTRAEARLSSGC